MSDFRRIAGQLLDAGKVENTDMPQEIANPEDGMMNAHVKELFEEARKLSADERIELADLLYADTVTPDSEWEAAWAAEARCRIDAYRRGEIQAVDADEMHARIKEAR